MTRSPSSVHPLARRPRWSRLPSSWVFSAALLGCAGSTPPRADDPGKPGEDARHEERLVYRRALGGLGAGYLFQTHISIGTTADLLGRNAYEPEEVEALMGTTIGMGKSVDEMLNGLGDVELGPGDQETLTQMRAINRMLGEQATALQTFARDRTEKNAKRFAEIRSSTWNRLQRLFKMQPPPVAAHGS